MTSSYRRPPTTRAIRSSPPKSPSPAWYYVVFALGLLGGWFAHLGLTVPKVIYEPAPTTLSRDDVDGGAGVSTGIRPAKTALATDANHAAKAKPAGSPALPGSVQGPGHGASVSGTPIGTVSPFPLPWRDDPRARHGTLKDALAVRSGSFTLPCTMPDLAEVTVDWCVPVDAEGRPLPTSADLVLVFPYPTQKQTISFPQNGPTFSAKLGFTTLCVNFPGMDPASGVPGDDRSRFYYYPESGSGPAWRAAIDRIRAMAGFPERTVLCTGLSGGGSAAGLFAEAYPDQVMAVYNEAGRVFADPPRFPGPVLLAHGHEDYTKPDIVAEEARRLAAGLPVERITYPPDWGGRGAYDIWRHCAGGPARDFVGVWLAAVADLRLERAGHLPPMENWPTRWNDLPMPSAAARDLWAQVPQPAQAIAAKDLPTVWLAEPLRNEPPKALVILIDQSFSACDEDMRDDVEQLRQGGFLVAGVAGDEAQAMPALKAALRDPRFNRASGKPWVPVLYRESLPEGLLSLRSLPPAQVVALGPGTTQAVEALLADIRKAPVPVKIQDLAERIERWKTVPTTGLAITWKAQDPKNRGQWHFQMVREVSAALGRLAASGKPAPGK